ncbi:MAG: GNAT family N-acetyltransferase [Pseudomonadota bacterium]
MSLDYVVERGFRPDHRVEAARLYWAAFSGKLDRVMGPDKTALAFLANVLDPNFAFSAVTHDNRLLGIAGFKTKAGAFVGGDFKTLADVYGWFGASWRGLLLHLIERDLRPELLLMDGIFVDEAARGAGVGSTLLREIVGEAQRRSLQGVRLDVIDSNSRARALYEREGFKPVSTSIMGPLRPIFGFKSSTTMIRRVPVADG